jgi:hypothetical protein
VAHRVSRHADGHINFLDMVPWRLFANHNPAGGSVHLSDFFDEIKTECVKVR